MHTIVDVDLKLIDSNPFRGLNTYPWIESKIATLMRSIEDVGLWAGAIARTAGGRYQLAFGHHRIEAARRCKLKKVPLILRDDLDDTNMLKFMGRENGEDFNTDFLVLLNTWESAVSYVGTAGPKKVQPLEIARFLGWVSPGSNGKERISHTAAACAAAQSLVENGHIARADLRGLTVRDAREIVVTANERITQIGKIGAAGKRPKAEIAQVKNLVAIGARTTAEEARQGRVAQSRLRNEVGMNTLRAAHRSKMTRATPMFTAFADQLIGKVGRMLNDDRSAAQLDSIAAVINDITLDEDHAVLRRLHHELGELSLRAEQGIRKTTPGKIVKLKTIEG